MPAFDIMNHTPLQAVGKLPMPLGGSRSSLECLERFLPSPHASMTFFIRILPSCTSLSDHVGSQCALIESDHRLLMAEGSGVPASLRPSREEGRGEGSLGGGEISWEPFSHWVCCVCIVTFDLELGQAMEVHNSHALLRRVRAK